MIVLWPLGGVAVSAGAGRTHRDQIFISAMGPATHFPMALVWLLLYFAAYPYSDDGAETADEPLSAERRSDWFAIFFWSQFTTNMALFCFNAMIPCFPLDCSNMLMNALFMLGVGARETALRMVVVSVPIIAIIAALGVWSLAVGNPSAMLTLCMCGWLGFQTYTLYRAYKEDQVAAHPMYANVPAKERDDERLVFQLPTMRRMSVATAVALALFVEHVARFK